MLGIFHEKGYKTIYELGIIQISFMALCLFTSGLLYGLLLFLLGYYAFYHIMDYFGYQMVRGIDVVAAMEIDSINVRNCICYMKMDKINAEELRDQYFYPKGVLKFRRLRQIWVQRYGFWFLKDIDPKLARFQVKKIDESIKTQDDINNYMARLSTFEFDSHEPLWQVHVCENYDENTSVVFMTVHHLISDGMGIISLMTLMNDKVSPDNISSHRVIPFMAYYILPILYFPIGLFRFTYIGITCKGDPDMFPFSLKTGRQSLHKTYFESKCYHLDDLRKCYNSYGNMKLNDFMFASISAAFYRYFKELGVKNPTYFSISVPVNMKPMPKTLEEVQLNNHNAICVAKIPISTDIEYVKKKAREYFDTGFSLTALRFAMFVVASVGLMPDALCRLCLMDNSKALDILISNTPGPKKPIYFCDQKVSDIGGTGPNIGGSGLTFLISSYCERVKLQVLADKNLNMDPKKLLMHIEKQLDDSISKYCDNKFA